MPQRKQQKKSYRPPKVRTEKVYERSSLACGKTHPKTPGCLGDPHKS